MTSGKGPVECELAVALALRELLRECRNAGIETEVLHQEQGKLERTICSVTLCLRGEKTGELASSWKGIVQWTCISPYRKMHRRKNWFVAVNVLEQTSLSKFSEKDVEFTTMRASGAGGQHVNKTNSAVRAKHLPSGVAVTAMESRSQHENKKLALKKLKERIRQWELGKMLEQTVAAWLNHHQLERGRPRRVYEGPEFILKNKNRKRDNEDPPCRSTREMNSS